MKLQEEKQRKNKQTRFALLFFVVLILIALYFTSKTSQEAINHDTTRETSLIDKIPYTTTHHAWIEFSIDNYNKTITLHGVLGNQLELDNIISTFTQYHMDKTIKHDVSLVDTVSSNDFALNISLLLASISEIKRAEIKYTADIITLKGLVLDDKSEQKTLNDLNNIFSNEIKIINQLEQVFEENTKVKPLEF